jgi:hypothetical protein
VWTQSYKEFLETLAEPSKKRETGVIKVKASCLVWGCLSFGQRVDPWTVD